MPQVEATKGRAADREVGVPRHVGHGTLRLRRSPRADFMPVNAVDAPSAGPIAPPVTPFWKQVFATALRETREALRLDSAVRIFTGIGAPAAAFLIAARYTGQPTWAGLLTVGVVLSIGVVFLAIKILSFPPKMFRALQLGMAETASQMVDAELDFRAELVDRLAAYYVTSRRGANARIRAGLALPPPEWINGQLLEMGESWCIHDVRGTRYRISDHACDTPQGGLDSGHPVSER